MLNTPLSRRGMVSSPHHLASEAGLRVLRDGGNAVEAAIAVAATLAVVYPHMTGLGGDGFWLIAAPNRRVIAIDGCGRAGAAVTPALFARAGMTAIPWRGPLAAVTVAGTVSGWQEAQSATADWGHSLALERLFEDAVFHARDGFAVTTSQTEVTAAKRAELAAIFGFGDAFLAADGSAPNAASVFRLPALADTFERLARDGLDSFYRGPVAGAIAADLARAGSPLMVGDLARHRAVSVTPLVVDVPGIRLFNLPPPTQGLASLMILALFARLGVTRGDSFDHIHGLVEATKRAFRVRDAVICDPHVLPEPPDRFLSAAVLDPLAAGISRDRALPWPVPAVDRGDTIWLGVIDDQGRAVSMNQSVYFEFGAGLVLPETGITWQNRGASFSLDPRAVNTLQPGRKPFHTLNPALARFADGRVMVYGTMGGEGQPQTQAALFSRYAWFGQGLQAAVTAPRWLLGRTWGDPSVTLKLESRFDPDLVAALTAVGHDIELLAPFTATMGHAGAIVRHADGVIAGATDPRSDGAACGF